jgi:hypothetical protein
MKKAYLLSVFLMISVFAFSQVPAEKGNASDIVIPEGDNEMIVEGYNFTSFSSQSTNITNELIENTPASLELHPEFGILPKGAPCEDCYELLDKREPNKRQFVKYGTNGSVRLYQQAYDAYNYIDGNGWLRSLDRRLSASTTESNVFVGENQPSLTKVDLNNFNISIADVGNELVFNNNLKLYININGANQFLANADWGSVTVGEDGAYVTDIFPGIDLEIIALHGAFKSNYIIKNNLNLSTGDFLVIEDEFLLPPNTSFNLNNSFLNQDGHYQGQLDINDDNTNANLFYMEEATIYDESHTQSNSELLSYKIENNNLELYVPLSFLNDTSRVYPIIVDPLLSANNTATQASVRWSGINNFGSFTNACSYNLSVAVPPEVTVTDIIWKFDYRAQNFAWLSDGALDFVYNGCRSPSGAGFYWYCNSIGGGTCNSGAGISVWGDWSACVPAPQCPSYNMNFTMNFYERYRWGGATCSSTYITSNSNWVMTVEGRTVEQTPAPTSSNGLTICDGSSTTLTATGSYGVPPYTYSWSSGGTGQSETVTPPNSSVTNYSCTITDACGNIAVNSVNITTQAQTMFPTPALNYSMSPASGTPCPVTVTYFTNVGTSYSGGPENYQWSFPGGTVTGGGATSGSANGPTYGGSGGQYTVVYNTAGYYIASIEMTDAGQCAANSIGFPICGALPVTLTSFKGELIDGSNVKLDWVTESEINNDFFTIEKSKDAQKFEVIGVVDGNGNSNVVNNYDLIDENPYEGINYYRLMQTDFDGTTKYSEIISINVSDNFGDLIVYPNPVEGIGYVSFNSNVSGVTEIVIYDVAGRKVLVEQYDVEIGDNKLVLSTHDLKQGMYFLTIGNEKETSNIKFIKD